MENQDAADVRIPILIDVPAAIRFLSCEPLIGPVSLSTYSLPPHRAWNKLPREHRTTWADTLDWVIAGGESGLTGRPMLPAWARSLRDECVAAGTPFFFKQWGEYGTITYNMMEGTPVFREFLNHEHWCNKAPTWVNGGFCIGKSGKFLRIGRDFVVSEFPVTVMHRLGKHKSGRILDGREWNELPEVGPV